MIGAINCNYLYYYRWGRKTWKTPWERQVYKKSAAFRRHFGVSKQYVPVQFQTTNTGIPLAIWHHKLGTASVPTQLRIEMMIIRGRSGSRIFFNFYPTDLHNITVRLLSAYLARAWGFPILTTMNWPAPHEIIQIHSVSDSESVRISPLLLKQWKRP